MQNAGSDRWQRDDNRGERDVRRPDFRREPREDRERMPERRDIFGDRESRPMMDNWRSARSAAPAEPAKDTKDVTRDNDR